MEIIRTVLGDIAPDDLGITLVHEHIISCSFVAISFLVSTYILKPKGKVIAYSALR